jgi:hypothetical protein
VLPRRRSGDQNVGCAEFVGIIATNTAHPVYVGASGRSKGAPRPLRYTLNAQFVTKRATAERIRPPYPRRRSTIPVSASRTMRSATSAE